MTYKKKTTINNTRITAIPLIAGNKLTSFEIDQLLYNQELQGIKPYYSNCEIIINPEIIKITHSYSTKGISKTPKYLKIKHITIFYLNMN